ncbi:hypothetical protein ETAA8_23510 [Anatilimnocola aggregata]|uniref:Uncharacterized protein n=1 Tax=Anatilimnocola aggregata TaxID=2528021 RepID=A0A517YAL7_9BACT|nr:hypothetical protein ETAA8_23510 [Anatilimnocola aggregata]
MQIGEGTGSTTRLEASCQPPDWQRAAEWLPLPKCLSSLVHPEKAAFSSLMSFHTSLTGYLGSCERSDSGGSFAAIQPRAGVFRVSTVRNQGWPHPFSTQRGGLRWLAPTRTCGNNLDHSTVESRSALRFQCRPVQNDSGRRECDVAGVFANPVVATAGSMIPCSSSERDVW